MKSYLSGMPECKFGINDKIVMDSKVTPEITSSQAPSYTFPKLCPLTHSLAF